MLQLKYNLDSDKVAYIPNGVEKRFFISRKHMIESRFVCFTPVHGSTNAGYFICAMH